MKPSFKKKVINGHFDVAMNRLPFTSQVYADRMSVGATVFDVVNGLPIEVLPPLFASSGTVRINGVEVPRSYWTHVRPKQGTCVTLHHTPLGGGGNDTAKNIGVIVASIAIVALTGFVGAGGLAALGAGSFFASGTLGASLASAAIGTAGLLAINALSPSPQVPNNQIDRGPSQGTSSVDGNIAPRGGRPYTVIGTHKVYPTMGMEPLYYISGEDEYVDALYILDGPHKMEDIRVDGSPIEDLEDVEYSVSEGFGNESPMTFFSKYTYTDGPQIELSLHDVGEDSRALQDQSTPSNSYPQWNVVISKADPDEIWIDIVWPEGVFDTDNVTRFQGIPYRLRMKELGGDTYVNFPEIHFIGKRSGLYRKSIRIIRGPETAGVTGPSKDAFRYGFHTVPAQDIAPVGSGDQWNADSHFVGSATINDVNNVIFRFDRAEIFVDETIMPTGKIWQVEILGGGVYDLGDFHISGVTVYESDASDGILAGYRNYFEHQTVSSEAVISRNVETVSYKSMLLRIVSIYNDSPMNTTNMAYLAIRGRNRNFARVSVIASAYVRDYGYEDIFQGWYFTSGIESWGGYSTDLTLTRPGIMRVTSTGSDPIFKSPLGLGIDGTTYPIVRMKIRRIAGANWEGNIYFDTMGDGTDYDYTQNVAEPTWDDAWHELEWDMTTASGAGDPWEGNTIHSFEFHLGDTDATDVFEIQWIEVCNKDGGIGWHAFRPTSNPVPHYLDTWCFDPNPDPLSLDILDEAEILAWKDFCDKQDFECNHIIDNIDILSVARLLASCGRGQLRLSDTLGILYDYDRSSEAIANLLSPRTTRDFKFSKLFNRPPNALFVRFTDRNLDYRENYTLVENPFTLNWDGNYIEEEINYAGLTSEEEVIRRANYDFRQLRYRDMGYSLTVDIEQLAVDRGSLIGVSHNSIKSIMTSQRIREIYTSGPNVTGLKMETPFQQYYEDGLFATGALLATQEMFILGYNTSVSIRYEDGSVYNFDLAGTTGESQDITFDTPFTIPADLVEGSLCTFAAVSETYLRGIVVGVEPQDELTATLTFVDAAPEVVTDLI